ncbi:MAG: glucose sorbosone dehydrogenase [Verrucomicrobiales bacterium]|nr:glucose sorbosone dehydrogenase [Verrucomicrobiales bacterium]
MIRVWGLLATIVWSLLPISSLSAAICLTRTNSPLLALPATLETSGYITEAVFPGVKCRWPVSLATPVGETNRLFVAEKDGYISVITNLAAPTRTVFLDITNLLVRETQEDGLLGMAFHPGYATNGYVYVFYNTSINGAKSDCIARFQVDPQNPNRALRDSHTIVIYQVDGSVNHNAGDLHFGLDGYLYASMGDPNGLSQQIYDLHSGILRIDVDRKPGNVPPNAVTGATDQYFVPIDNPYVGATSYNGSSVDPTQTRTEFYATGLRNPFRFCFDSLTGDLYVGDVGLWTWEEIDVVEKGKNYGWGYMEGTDGFGFGLTPPLHEYGHGEGLAVIGGRVYRGAQIPDLYGCYVFGDYASGTIWSLRYQGGEATDVRELCNYPAVVCFGTDPRNGDVLLASADMTIRRIAKTGVPTSIQIPALLSQTGAFSNLTTLTPVAGIVPYDINVPFWSDHAEKRRWFMVPTGQKIDFQRDDNWHFPVGTTWIKHFDMEMVAGDPSSKRKIETRFLVATADGAYGLSYAWNQQQTDATLVSASGAVAQLTITNGGNVTSQEWQFPSRSQCLACHTRHAEFTLGFTTRQLNRNVPCGGGVVNQIEAMSDAGYFTSPVTNRNTLPALAAATDPNGTLEFRARSYLTANCSQCHQRFGWGFGNWDARISTPFTEAGLITPEMNDYSYIDQVITPGSPGGSMVLQRMQGIGGQRMPPIGSSILDQSGINLLSEWVQDIPNRHSLNGADRSVDSDGDGASDYQEYLAGTDPTDSGSVWKSTLTKFSNHLDLSFSNVLDRIYEVQWSTNLLQGWQALDHPNNSPNPKTGSGTSTLNLGPSTNGNYFYRVQIRDP